jgi:hypothetical protein
MLHVKAGKRQKNNTEYQKELQKAVEYFFDNNGNVPMLKVSSKFPALVYSDIDKAIMMEAHRRAIQEREWNKQKEELQDEIIGVDFNS